jgi:transposase
MARSTNEIRSVFVRLHKQGKNPIEIAKILGVTRQTVTNWRSILKNRGEDSLLADKWFRGSIKKVDELTLINLFEERKTSTNEELSKVLKVGVSTVQRYRNQLGYTYKKGTYTYKEANDEAKKNSK